jgi:LCP family protein required for cell wall assembly
MFLIDLHNRTLRGWPHRSGHWLVILALLVFLAPACTFPGLYMMPAPIPINTPHPNLYRVPADATATATPFQPLPPTPTFLPTQKLVDQAEEPELAVEATSTQPPTPTPTQQEVGVFPGPSEWSPLPIPPPVTRLPKAEGQVDILLLGSDQRVGDGGFRTDTILLLSLNPKAGTASLVSFPRDLFIYIPGWTMQRINTAMAHGGFETMAMTIDYNFGVRPDHFVMINFYSFVEVIDSLGGIDIDVPVGLGDNRDGWGYFYLPPGPQHMDGDIALWYVRSRYTTSDFDRTRRQQEVLQATYRKILSLDGVKRAPELYDIYVNNVTTDLTFSIVAPLVPLAATLGDTTRIQHYYIGSDLVTGYLTPTGAQVLLPNRAAVMEVMRQAIVGP